VSAFAGSFFWTFVDRQALAKIRCPIKPKALQISHLMIIFAANALAPAAIQGKKCGEIKMGTQSRIELPGIDLEFRDYEHQPDRLQQTLDTHYILSFSLSPTPSGSRANFEGMKEPVAAGDMIFLPAGIKLLGYCDGARQSVLHCRISPNRFDTLVGSVRGWAPEQLRKCLDLQDPRIRAGMQRLAQELSAPGFASRITIESIVNLLVVDSLRCIGRDTEKFFAKGGLTARQLRCIETLVEDVERPPPSVGALAQAMGITGRHLLRAYKQSTGSTLRTYLRAAQQRRAADLLISTDLPLRMIAEKLGYSRLSCFSTAFQNATGISPSAYRRRRIQ
jgi:AraC family transcriptional regulator